MRSLAATRRIQCQTTLLGLLAALGAIAAAGCAGPAKNLQHHWTKAAPVELSETPFYPQERYQCGPAALMTVLQFSGADADLAEITKRVYLPGRRGSLQADMLAATRFAGRVPYSLDPSLAALLAELDAGRPVIVLQNLGVSWFPRWHYAVLIGTDPAHDRVVLRSGTDRRRLTDIGTFLRTWRRSGNWAIVALRPGELPAVVDRLRYFDSLAAMQQTGRTDVSRDGWIAALERWPQDTVALFGLANAELAARRYAKAEEIYRQLLTLDPQALLAQNNLAYALAAQGKVQQAIRELESALKRAGNDAALRSELEDSLAEIADNLNST